MHQRLRIVPMSKIKAIKPRQIASHNSYVMTAASRCVTSLQSDLPGWRSKSGIGNDGQSLWLAIGNERRITEQLQTNTEGAGQDLGQRPNLDSAFVQQQVISLDDEDLILRA